MYKMRRFLLSLPKVEIKGWRAGGQARPRFGSLPDDSADTGASKSHQTSHQHFNPPDDDDDLSIEEHAKRKIGWLLKLIFAGTASVAAYQFFPYMGDNLMQQSVSLLRVKDPLFKRIGASRLERIAIDDEKRMKIVKIGGGEELTKMLGSARDERTRKEALKALVALSISDEAVKALVQESGAVGVVLKCTPASPDSSKLRLSLLNRFRDLKYSVDDDEHVFFQTS